ncbi:hypothetical protein SARC_04900 [Sphaeroforma arctica JP610]|uniref:Uncharacterized protein n=1 Tax=Sphaeroforma arctica JP610 TaxID=667725 RepID=A0A0L0G114_9EUKA|nr:hypothetical protein SARC_04900 [Sphaeroforma arctica JP610]KNC82817.1 hypothetical protein SARC_04900 [Sphaeroforma arctica JP610]|eukprot:XP_014156719.1 hypothetical protein SARC_04900 [Sphaeroforma arctica JP610]
MLNISLIWILTTHSCNPKSHEEECSFNNICVLDANKPTQKWFVFDEMGYNNTVPFNIKRIGRSVFDLNIDVYHPKTNRFADIFGGRYNHILVANSIALEVFWFDNR